MGHWVGPNTRDTWKMHLLIMLKKNDTHGLQTLGKKHKDQPLYLEENSHRKIQVGHIYVWWSMSEECDWIKSR